MRWQRSRSRAVAADEAAATGVRRCSAGRCEYLEQGRKDGKKIRVARLPDAAVVQREV